MAAVTIGAGLIIFGIIVCLYFGSKVGVGLEAGAFGMLIGTCITLAGAGTILVAIFSYLLWGHK